MCIHIENIISEYSEQSKYNSQRKHSELFTSVQSINLTDCYKQFSLSTAIPLRVQYQSETASNYNIQIIHYFVFLYIIH